MEKQIIVYEGTDDVRLEVKTDGETVWLTQAMMAELFEVVPQNITLHIKNIYFEGELDERATCKVFLQVRQEGSRQVQRQRPRLEPG